MTMRMLIDARHQEETRVAVVKGNRIEEFDFESAEHKQLKGNIYLAKVTRVEPSLQAAFIEFGGNRHGFLAFSEIHPDYYQIPKEDREALLREEAEHHAEEEAIRRREDDEEESSDARSSAQDADIDVESIERIDDDGGAEPFDAAEDHPHDDREPDDRELDGRSADDQGPVDGDARSAPAPSGNNGGDGDAVDALRTRRMNLRRRYKIQDVIRRRQVLLVQVVKEERGNKGAALTTYLSLAGRYCVLMPNTAHGGGISRKISSPADRKRLKSIMSDLQLPATMGCIVRTAGLQRTKIEIRRDFDYLARLWDEIRDKTLHSSAPALIHEDSGLIKRAIRDIYNREIDEVIVEGEDGYRSAREFMKLLMPSHARKVQPYVDAVPLFQRAGVEDQLAGMYQPVVQLKSGGYLVINPTEALVSIDINSGRSTREHNIEQTATATNLEASYEIARQLRLRDMAGLVVIDFIDMEVGGNIRKVEKALKDALKDDRARIQVGRISSFGLMEMSRQRLRTGVLEASTRQCPHCEGTGLVRTASSAGLSALRMLEDEAARGRGSRLCLRASQEAAIYVLNRKRGELAEIEDRYGVFIEIVPDGAIEGARMTVTADGPPPAHAPKLPPPPMIEPDDDEPFVDEAEDEGDYADDGEETPERAREAGAQSDEAGPRRKRRRRRRGGRRDELPPQDGAAGDEPDEERGESAETGEPVEATEEERPEGSGEPRRGRRGRRGGRRGRGGADRGGEAIAEAAPDLFPNDEATRDEPVPEAAPEPVAEEARPKTRRRPRARSEDAAIAVSDTPVAPPGTEVGLVLMEPIKPRRSRRKAAEPAEPADGAEPVEAVEAPVSKPRRSRAKAAEVALIDEGLAGVTDAAPEPAAEAPIESAIVAADDGDDDADGTPRRGWWQRTFGN